MEQLASGGHRTTFCIVVNEVFSSFACESNGNEHSIISSQLQLLIEQ